MDSGIYRRDFIKVAATAGVALVVGLNSKGVIAVGNEKSELNPFVRVSEEGVVTVVIKHFEMGQGTTTGLATLVAEELDADWETLAVEFAPADNKKYKNLAFGAQGTGGSTAIANSFMQYRAAGATARDVLVRAAAAHWSIPSQEVIIEKGILKASGRSLHFGQVIGKALTLVPTAEPKLKSPEQFTLIGNENLHRMDNKDKTQGTAIFALDVKVPGMVYAVILYPPRFGAKLTTYDSTKAKQVAGFLNVKKLPDAKGLVVYASSTWAAISARKALVTDWDFKDSENRSTDELVTYHRTLLQQPTYQARKEVSTQNVNAAIESAVTVIEKEFIFPNLAHAPMEPLNCVIEPTEEGVRVHDGCQFPGLTQPAVANVLGLEPKQVEINTVYAGGSFGRRATPTSDYQVDAALAFLLLGRKTAVKLMWTREDDIKGGYYRPMVIHKARIGLDGNGNITGWDHRVATKSIIKGSPFEGSIKDGVDHASVEGVSNTEYQIPLLSVGLSDAQTKIPVLWWRSVGHTHTAYTMEVLLDIIAEAAKQDPVKYRLGLLSKESKEQKRIAGVLKLAVEKSDWDSKLPVGRGRGVAVHKSFNSYVAQVIEVSVNDTGKVKVESVHCAVDCGVAVNPDVIKAQMEGGIGFGLGAVMRNEITFTDGVVDQSNFPDYEPLRIKDMPKVSVHIVRSAEPPTGVGEPGVPPSGPALANAIYAATGKRIIELPMSKHGVEFV